MSWVKIDDGAPEHPKLLAAGVAACWLWLCGLAYCNRQKRRDGVIPLAKVKLLYPGLGLKHADALVVAGLWERLPDAYRVHDYHEYQPSEPTEELSLTRSKAGRAGGIKSGATRRSKSEASLLQATKQNGSNAPEAPSRPDPEEREIPPPPSEPRQARPDPFAASFQPIRADVTELHEAWRRTTGKTGHKLRGGATDLEATTLADAIDLHGLADCLVILSVAMQDGMVNGSADEKRQKHDSIRYLFGNEQTFSRLLMAAQKAAKKSAGNGALERAMTAEPDTSDVYVPSPRSPQ